MSTDTGLTNARERALLAEEKWLVENLKKIRAQRKALEEELVYLEHMKSEVYNRQFKKYPTSDSQNAGGTMDSQNAGGTMDSQNAGGTMDSQNAGGNSHSQNAGVNMDSQNAGKEFEIPEPVGDTNPSNIDDFNILEENCNEIENLNLTVIPDSKPNMDMMEPEYDTDEEDGDWNNVDFDMGLLVSGYCCNKFRSQ